MTMNSAAFAVLAAHGGSSPIASGGGATSIPSAAVDRFQALMQKAPMDAPATADPSVLSRAVAAQDAQMQQTLDDVTQFSQAAPTMSMAERSAHTIKLMEEVTVSNISLQSKMGLVESSKSAVETLMKNQ